MTSTRQILSEEQLTRMFAAQRRILIVNANMQRGRIVVETLETPTGPFSVFAMTLETYRGAVSRALELTGNDPRRDSSWPVERFSTVSNGMVLIPVQQSPNTVDALEATAADVPYRDWAIRL